MEPPNDLNNNPHLRGANERFLSGGQNPRLYTVAPAVEPLLHNEERHYLREEADFYRNRMRTYISQMAAIPAASENMGLVQQPLNRYIESRNYYRDATQQLRDDLPTVDITGPPPLYVTRQDVDINSRPREDSPPGFVPNMNVNPRRTREFLDISDGVWFK